jgi:N6-L-threonylcarbamoyladenine synthase
MTDFVLGIESSCDETSVAIVSSDRRILGHIILSQSYHATYGGVVPEIAARGHMDHLDQLIQDVLKQAQLNFSDLSAIAASCGPGLIGGVIVGAMTGKAIAYAHKLPFIAVNHLEGHALSARLDQDIPFPFLLLLMSGGHTQFLLVEDIGHYTILGTTLDDAIGEAFDKTAKIMGLPYPGGMHIEAFAKHGNENAFDFPRPLKGNGKCDFSFSGLKTAVKYKMDTFKDIDDNLKADICASFQKAVLDVLVDRARNACQKLSASAKPFHHFVVAGVALPQMLFCDKD